MMMKKTMKLMCLAGVPLVAAMMTVARVAAVEPVALGWVMDAEAMERAEILGFRVYVAPEPAEGEEPEYAIKAEVTLEDLAEQPDGSSGTTFDLRAGTYRVYVTAYNAVLESGPSNVIGVVSVLPKPDAPKGLRRIVLSAEIDEDGRISGIKVEEIAMRE